MSLKYLIGFGERILFLLKFSPPPFVLFLPSGVCSGGAMFYDWGMLQRTCPSFCRKSAYNQSHTAPVNWEPPLPITTHQKKKKEKKNLLIYREN